MGKICFFSAEQVTIVKVYPKLSFSIKQNNEIIIGRLHALELNIEERDIIILNMYGPNTDSVNHFEIFKILKRK